MIYDAIFRKFVEFTCLKIAPVDFLLISELNDFLGVEIYNSPHHSLLKRALYCRITILNDGARNHLSRVVKVLLFLSGWCRRVIMMGLDKKKIINVFL